jgi:hypothetical protein
MSEDYERLCASAQAFVYAAMIRLMVRRLAHGRDSPNSFRIGVLGNLELPVMAFSETRLSPIH